MNLSEFSGNYLPILLQKILKEKKNVFLFVDYAGANEFIDSLSFYVYLPYFLHPRVTGHLQTKLAIYFPTMFQKKQCAKSNFHNI